MAELTLESLAAEVAALRDQLAALRGDAIERYYTLPEVALLVGCGLDRLRRRVQEAKAHLSPAVYRWDKRHVRHRMLPASDVRTLRRLAIRPTLHGMAA